MPGVMSDPGARVFPPDGRLEPAGPTTPGMHRLEAMAEPGIWLGTVTTEPRLLTGWHHHGEYDTYIYVLAGEARFDTFEDGAVRRQAAGPGSFVHVRPHTPHREGSASPTGIEAVRSYFDTFWQYALAAFKTAVEKEDR